MMIYKVHLWQEYGCDYTIGCGIKIADITASSIEEAYSKLSEIIKEDYTGEMSLSGAKIYEVTKVIVVDVKSIYAKAKEEKKQKEKIEKETKEKEEYERLKKIYEGNTKEHNT